jgi:hypothetical protein
MYSVEENVLFSELCFKTALEGIISWQTRGKTEGEPSFTLRPAGRQAGRPAGRQADRKIGRQKHGGDTDQQANRYRDKDTFFSSFKKEVQHINFLFEIHWYSIHKCTCNQNA